MGDDDSANRADTTARYLGGFWQPALSHTATSPKADTAMTRPAADTATPTASSPVAFIDDEKRAREADRPPLRPQRRAGRRGARSRHDVQGQAQGREARRPWQEEDSHQAALAHPRAGPRARVTRRAHVPHAGACSRMLPIAPTSSGKHSYAAPSTVPRGRHCMSIRHTRAMPRQSPIYSGTLVQCGCPTVWRVPRSSSGALGIPEASGAVPCARVARRCTP